jgi:NADPH-dependent F420 reductase
MNTREMTIAVIGDGNVGNALATRLHKSGHNVRFGVRDVAGTDGAEHAISRATVSDALREAQVVFLAVPAMAAMEVLASAPSISGTIIVDCTNPVRWDAGPVIAPPDAGSVAAQIAAAFPDARVCKAFNHFGAEVHAQPQLAHGPADAYVASDHADAKAVVIALADAIGFRGRDAGPLRNARLLEHMAVLWIHLATVGGNGREFAFRQEGR